MATFTQELFDTICEFTADSDYACSKCNEEFLMVGRYAAARPLRCRSVRIKRPGVTRCDGENIPAWIQDALGGYFAHFYDSDRDEYVCIRKVFRLQDVPSLRWLFELPDDAVEMVKRGQGEVI